VVDDTELAGTVGSWRTRTSRAEEFSGEQRGSVRKGNGTASIVLPTHAPLGAQIMRPDPSRTH
jgi:hypothetical protein